MTSRPRPPTFTLPTDRDWLTPEEYHAYLASEKPRKYRNEPIVVEGVRWDSTGEYARWGELLTLERAGAISNLRRQVPYDLHAPSGRPIGQLVLDYVYEEGGETIYEDFKGGTATMTPLWRWKAKHFREEYGPIRVTGKKG